VTDRLLRLCLRAYPREARERDGEVLLGLARDLVKGGSPPLRQAVGLLRGGAGSWLRHGKNELRELPWLEARSRLAVPLAAALLALVLVGAERSTGGLAWVGWSWAVALAVGSAALAGAALGRHVSAVTGATVVAAVLALDGLRDVYGQGSRWVVSAGTDVDVLVMWLPAALLLVACAGAVDRPTARVGIRRIAWAAVPAAALLVLSSENVNAAESITVFGGLAAAAVLVAAGVLRRRRDPAAPLVAALVLAAAAPSVLWLIAGLLPAPDSGAPALALGYFAAGGLVTAASVLLLARLSGRRESRNLHRS
jgi:hypothetical protein